MIYNPSATMIQNIENNNIVSVITMLTNALKYLNVPNVIKPLLPIIYTTCLINSAVVIMSNTLSNKFRHVNKVW